MAMTAALVHGGTHFTSLTVTPRRTDRLFEPAEPKEAYDPLAEAAA